MQMKSICFVSIVLLIKTISSNHVELSVEACINAATKGDVGPCTEQLATTIFKIHQWGRNTQLKICGHSCRGNIKGGFRGFQWKWEGRFQCGSLAPGVVGTSLRFSKHGAIEWAIKDYIEKGIKKGDFKIQDFQCCGDKDWSFCTEIEI